MTFWRGFTIFTICGLLQINSVLAENFDVTNNNASGAGSLLQAITDLNSTGTNNPAAASNTISVDPAVGTITLGSDLPVITRGVTISKSSGSLTINGASSNRIFATRGASLTVGNSTSTTTLTNGLAQGGTGGTGNVFSASGGGGLGAGGGAYVDLGQQLSLVNTTISGCAARGGAGGSVSSGGGIIAGGGGGASWNTSKNGGTSAGGGDFPGLSSPSSAGGGVSEGVTGYGGGAGGAGFSGGTPGGAGGSGVGGDTSGGNGGAGGYCGGGGGANSSGGGGGGGGGNGGGRNTLTAPVGGGGGGYGSGGAGGNATSGSAAGGGGGLGGGGGGGSGGFPNGGGGGGGFGGGGGGGGSYNYAFGGSGGLYGGNGSSGNSGGSTLGGGGGGGGALGGAVFVGDGATFNVGDSVTIAPASNSVTGGAAGPGGVIPATGGTGYATDIFLFKSATLNFNGAANQTFNTAIQSDQSNPVSPAPPIILDNGVTVNLTVPASKITLGSTSNNWRGGTVITSGGITAGVTNLPAAGTISIASQGALTLSGGASANTITNAGTLSFTGAASTTAPITNSGTMSTSATFTNSSTLTNSGTLGISTATFTNSGILNNTGTINLSTTFTGVGTFTHSGILNINSVSFTQPSIFNNTGMTNLNGTANIVGNFTGSTGSGLTVANSSGAGYSTSGNITGLTNLNTIDNGTQDTVFTINNTVTGGSNSTFTIGENSTVNLESGAVVSGFNSIVIDGNYNIASGATYSLDSNNNLTGSSTGIISNEGQFFINGDISFPGTFNNLASGTTTINGTPTLNFSGSNPFVNAGNLITNFSSSNSLPTINATGAAADLSHGVIAIGYNNNFIASGNYTLINTGALILPSDVGVAILPQNTFYISDWSLNPVGNSLVVTVTRNGFGNHALTPQAQEIGNFLEQLGASNPNASQLQLLNALEGIQNDQQLTAALLSLLPPQYTMLVTLELLDQITGALDIRLATLHHGYNSGDEPGSDKVSVWLRPFSSTGTQQPEDTLSGYTDKNHGWLLGMDRTINDRVRLGAAASYSKTTVTDSLQSNTTTNINTYQFTFYSTLKSPKDIYVDALIAGGVSNYHGTRTIVFPGYVLGASSNYSSQQLTLKLRASKIFTLADFWQFTPNAMTQYSFVRQLAYTESGAGSYDVYTNPDNINLFRLGVGAMLGIPFTTNNMLSIPSVYTGLYVDANGGADTTNSQFVSGGPIITNSVQSGRLMLKYGFSYELKFNDHVEFVANYDYIWRNSGFKGTEGLLNFRYTF